MAQVTDLNGAPRISALPVSLRAFRAFIATRPDEERWELIDGIAMMMAPPTKAHQRIASNVQRLLLDALDRAVPDRTAYQRVGVNIGPSVANYDPEPDVVVVDAAINDLDERYADRFYLVAEIISASDAASIDGKRQIYKLHPHCACILTIRQDCVDVRIDRLTKEQWSEQTLIRSDDVLELPDFGLRCRVGDLYKGTPVPGAAPAG